MHYPTFGLAPQFLSLTLKAGSMTMEQAIDALKQAFPGDQIALPGTEAYEASNDVYLSARQSDYTPAAIFQPRNTQDVAAFLRLAKEKDVQFAIRGGGQQPLEACSNIEGGITVDLSLLRGIELKDGVVSVGAGERWGPVYEKVQAAGLGVAGSRSARGGIGGLALSGGLSFFSSREGFICDNVVGFEVVLASGHVVRADAAENPDLWRALRGGGNNFGVVTRFDLRTFPQRPFWGGMVFYAASGANWRGQVEALVDEVRGPEPSADTHIMVSLGYSAQFGDRMMGLNGVYYTGPDAASACGAEEGPAETSGKAPRVPPPLRPFTDVQPQLGQLGSLRTMTLAEAAAEHAVMAATERQRCAYMNCTLRADAGALVSAAEIYAEAVGPLKPVEGVTLSFTLQAYPVSLLRRTAELGGNALGLDAHARAGEPLVSVLLLTCWRRREDDARVMGVLRGALGAIERDADARGQRVPYTYLNYASDFQDPLSSYGEENKRFLREVGRKYDPDGLFQKNVPGGFKLYA